MSKFDELLQEILEQKEAQRIARQRVHEDMFAQFSSVTDGNWTQSDLQLSTRLEQLIVKFTELEKSQQEIRETIEELYLLTIPLRNP